MNFPTPIYIVSAKRTPIGSLQGALSSVAATELGASALKAALESASLPPEVVDQVILGSVLTAGQGQAPARQAMIKAGIPVRAQALTVNKVCSSGLKAIILGAQEIALGQAEIVLAGGMESMSNAPYLLPSLRTGARLGNVQALDSIVQDGLWDPYQNYHMGSAAELCARERSISREAQDAFAIRSYERAKHAISQGHFRNEIVPVNVTIGKNTSVVDTDEEPSKLKMEKVPELKPVFEKQGTVTAANASSINDGAAALVLCSEAALKKYNLKPLATILAHGFFSREPEWFTIAPIDAMRSMMKAANVGLSDLDLVEINEAFSGVGIVCQQELGIADERFNVSGGAVALGHPIGASGARIVTTLVHNLIRTGGQLGAVGICNGGGEATALLVKRC